MKPIALKCPSCGANAISKDAACGYCGCVLMRETRTAPPQAVVGQVTISMGRRGAGALARLKVEEPPISEEEAAARAYELALSVVIQEQKASISLLQRKLNFGYGKAALILDRMEEEGVVGPDQGAGKPRVVLSR